MALLAIEITSGVVASCIAGALAGKAVLHGLLRRSERSSGVPSAYLHEILTASWSAFLVFVAFLPLANYRRRLPARCWHAARVVATQHADCSTCLQIVVAQARSDGLAAPLLRAILERGDVPEDIRDIVDFTRRVLSHDAGEDDLRQKVRAKYGERGLIDLAYAIASSQVFPSIKQVLGHAVSCERVLV